MTEYIHNQIIIYTNKLLLPVQYTKLILTIITTHVGNDTEKLQQVLIG